VVSVTFVCWAREQKVVDSFVCVFASWANGGVNALNNEKMFIEGRVAGT
jgi:hypothetical protein